jgi:hypothetical protein
MISALLRRRRRRSLWLDPGFFFNALNIDMTAETPMYFSKPISPSKLRQASGDEDVSLHSDWQ